jgi:hypothetical protein
MLLLSIVYWLVCSLLGLTAVLVRRDLSMAMNGLTRP